jgi:pantothenate kinase
MQHNFLSDQQLNEIEERYKSLQKLLMIDVEALIRDVRAYKQKANVAPSAVSNVDWDNLPMTLRPKHIEQILGISQRKVYEFLNKVPFHIVRDGHQIYISKTVFRNWIEGT